MKQFDWTDQKVETFIGILLRAGVLLSAAVVLAGAVVYLAHHGRSPVNYTVFRGEPSELRGIGGIVTEALRANGRGIIQLGLLLLIATPIARVIFAIYGFSLEKDRMYVAFTAAVLAILLYSLLGTS